MKLTFAFDNTDVFDTDPANYIIEVRKAAINFSIHHFLLRSYQTDLASGKIFHDCKNNSVSESTDNKIT